MYKIVHDEQMGKYRVMTLENSATATTKYNRIKIADEIFPVVPVFDMPGYYAIESSHSHIGQTLEFIWQN